MTADEARGGERLLPMQEDEWRTYIALEGAGPRKGARAQQESAPWGNGEVCAPWSEALPAQVTALRALFAERRSAEHLGHPLDLTALRQLVALTLCRPAAGQPFRPYPTSGGCDELGILIAARRVQGLPEGAYWATMDGAGALSHAASLDERYAAFEQRFCPFLGIEAGDAPPAATLLVLADWRRLAARYERCVLASALWDCGALLQTISLAAAATRINACLCACVQPRLVEAWLHLDCREVGQVGLLALGGGPLPS